MLFSVDIYDLFSGISIGVLILSIVLILLIPIFALFFAIKIVDADNDSFGQVLLTYIIMMILSFGTSLIPEYGVYLSCIAFIIEIFIVKARHNISFGKALLVIIIYVIFVVIIVVIILFLFLGGLAAITGSI